jgi:hypothetical protein
MLFEGFVDVVDDTSVQGWVWCPTNPDMRPTVTLIDESFSVLAKAVARQFRSDVAQAGYADGCYGFQIDLTAIDNDRREIRAMVVVEPTWQRLTQDLLRIQLPDKKGRGNLDCLTGNELQGWYQPAGDGLPARVTIHVDGREEASAMANQYRSDLEDAGLGHGKWGFSCPIPRHLCDGKEHTFTAFAPDGNMLGQPITGLGPAGLYSPYVGRCARVARQFDPARGWLCLFQGNIGRVDVPDASVPLAVHADDALVALAFSDPQQDGAFSILIPREALLNKGTNAMVSVVVHGENFALSGLNATVGELMAHGYEERAQT